MISGRWGRTISSWCTTSRFFSPSWISMHFIQVLRSWSKQHDFCCVPCIWRKDFPMRYFFTLHFYILHVHCLMNIWSIIWCLHIIFAIICISPISPLCIVYINSPYQKNASKMQKKTYGDSLKGTTLFSVMYAWHQRYILWFTCSTTAKHTNAIWKHSLHTRLKISRASGKTWSNRDICHWCRLSKSK